MRKIAVHFETGMNGSSRDDVIEVEDNATDDEINESVLDFVATNYCSWGWEDAPASAKVTG